MRSEYMNVRLCYMRLKLHFRLHLRKCVVVSSPNRITVFWIDFELVGKWVKYKNTKQNNAKKKKEKKLKWKNRKFKNKNKRTQQNNIHSQATIVVVARCSSFISYNWITQPNATQSLGIVNLSTVELWSICICGCWIKIGKFIINCNVY